MALGGGALILPVVTFATGAIIAARKAWRLNNLDGHIGQVTLNDVAIADIGLPSDMITASGGNGDALPRGYMLVKTAAKAAASVLADPVLDRSLSHNVVLTPVEADRWGDARPRPRYSVGPMKKDVPHFI